MLPVSNGIEARAILVPKNQVFATVFISYLFKSRAYFDENFILQAEKLGFVRKLVDPRSLAEK